MARRDPHGGSELSPPGVEVALSRRLWLGVAFIVRTCIPLKRVRLTQDTLLISNYWQEIRVPLRDVHDVTESRWINIHPVTLHLRHPTAFGSRVVFMPQTRWFGSGWPHPIVEEL